MHKNGKWASQIISLQESDGKWGCFHSLSKLYGAPLTTEQALRRLERLGYTIEDECIQSAVRYMSRCLSGDISIPDRAEKVHDWSVFSSLILSTWIRRFTDDNSLANDVASKWGGIISRAFASGKFDYHDYVCAYKEILNPNGGRIISLDNFYPVSLVSDCLDSNTENLFMDYIIERDHGIYYIYDRKIAVLPKQFESPIASRYLAAIELLAKYKYAKHKLNFVADWLNQRRNENGLWDMGGAVNDKVYFPLSDNWRKREIRESDCTERISALISEITG